VVINVNEELLLECADLSAIWFLRLSQSARLKDIVAGTRRQVTTHR
jgi:hypothetical protein